MFIKIKKRAIYCSSEKELNSLKNFFDYLGFDYQEIKYFGIRLLEKKYIISDGEFKFLKEYKVQFSLID